MTHSEASLTPEGLRTLNAICDEFRRQMKTTLLESKAGSPVSPRDVLAVAHRLQQSSWLSRFQQGDSDDSERRAA